jgi:HK97 family phage major capsid protein
MTMMTKPQAFDRLRGFIRDTRATMRHSAHDDGNARKIMQCRSASLGQIMREVSIATEDDETPLTAEQRDTLKQAQQFSTELSTWLNAAKVAHDAELRRLAAMPTDENQRVVERQHAATGWQYTDHRPDGDSFSGLPARRSGRTFASLFPSAASDTSGWADGAEYLQVIGRGLHDHRLRPSASSMIEHDGPAGGYAVPAPLFGSWLDASLESEIVRPRATTWGMTSKTLDVPAFNDLDRSSGDVAGLELAFTPETGTLTPQVAKLRAVHLTANKAALYVECSNELLNDAPMFAQNLGEAITRALSFGLDREFLFGTGAGAPLGALNAPCTVAVNRTTPNTVKYADLLAMFARLAASSVSKSVWIAHPSTIPQLGALSLAVGTGGSAIPVMSQTDGSFTILSRPVIFSEKMKALGTKADVALCDFSYYTIGLRQDAALERSGHVGFARDVETFRLITRIDGQPTLSGPITPVNGSDTLSPFVVLDTPAS